MHPPPKVGNPIAAIPMKNRIEKPKLLATVVFHLAMVLFSSSR
jgi:hypothetical protein